MITLSSDILLAISDQNKAFEDYCDLRYKQSGVVVSSSGKTALVRKGLLLSAEGVFCNVGIPIRIHGVMRDLGEVIGSLDGKHICVPCVITDNEMRRLPKAEEVFEENLRIQIRNRITI